MHNHTVSGTQSKQRQAINNKVLESVVNNAVYRYWVPACSMQQIGSHATYVAPTASIPGHWNLADGKDDSFSFYMSRPAEWRAGLVYPEVHWSTSVASNDVVFDVDMIPCALEGAFAGIGAVSFVVTAESTADLLTVTTLLDPTISSQSSINRAYGGIHVVLSVLAAHADDTNTGSKSIYGLDMVYRERTKPAGAK